MGGVKGILFVKVSLNNATLTKACYKSLSPRDMLILLGFTLVRQLEDIKFDDLPDHQRGREVQFCCLIAGVRWSMTHPGLVMDPGLYSRNQERGI